jgi:hypothetical protein
MSNAFRGQTQYQQSPMMGYGGGYGTTFGGYGGGYDGGYGQQSLVPQYQPTINDAFSRYFSQQYYGGQAFNPFAATSLFGGGYGGGYGGGRGGMGGRMRRRRQMFEDLFGPTQAQPMASSQMPSSAPSPAPSPYQQFDMAPAQSQPIASYVSGYTPAAYSAPAPAPVAAPAPAPAPVYAAPSLPAYDFSALDPALLRSFSSGGILF